MFSKRYGSNLKQLKELSKLGRFGKNNMLKILFFFYYFEKIIILAFLLSLLSIRLYFTIEVYMLKLNFVKEKRILEIFSGLIFNLNLANFNIIFLIPFGL